MCKVIVCGKGKCVGSNSSSLGYECECEKGWTQSRPHDGNSFKFLPCVVPQCQFFLISPNICITFRFSLFISMCSQFQRWYTSFSCSCAHPQQIKLYWSYETSLNLQSLLWSFIIHLIPIWSCVAACSWTDCGGGTCKKTSMLTHTCECNEGYYNLLNSTSFPCLKKRK